MLFGFAGPFAPVLPRLTFEVNYLETGIGLVPVLLGVFVVSEIFVQIADRGALGTERMLSKRSDVPEDNYVTWLDETNTFRCSSHNNIARHKLIVP